MRPININSFVNYVQFLSAKSMNGSISPLDLNTALPFVVGKVVRKYFGNPDAINPSTGTPSIAYETSQTVTDYIGQLKEDKMITVSDGGRMVKPSDYLHKSSVAASWVGLSEQDDAETDDCETEQTTYVKKKKKKIDFSWTPVTVLTDNQWANASSSSLRKPTKQYPVCRFFGDYVEFLPLDIRTVRFIYLRYPATPYWNYTIVGGTTPVYNPTGSVDIELPEICCDEMAVTLLSSLAIVSDNSNATAA